MGRHLKQYVAYHLKMEHKGTYVNGIIKILRAFFKYTNGEDYTDIAYEKVAWVREENPVIKAFSAQDARRLLEYYDNKSYLSCRSKKMKRRPKRILKQPNVFVSLFSEYKNKPLPLRTGALIVSGQNKIPAGVSRQDKGCERVRR